MHVLLIEDDPDYAFLIGEILRFGSNHSTLASTPESARRWLSNNRPDLVVLDLTLRGEDSLRLSQWLRDSYPELPVVLLSNDDRAEEVVRAFDSGADDVIAKPFHPRELSARIKAVARRTGIAARPRFPAPAHRIATIGDGRERMSGLDVTGGGV